MVLLETDGRFTSMIVINEDHYVRSVVYGAGRHTLSSEQVGTRYVLTGVRTLVDAADLEQVHALQDAIRVEQVAAGRRDLPE